MVLRNLVRTTHYSLILVVLLGWVHANTAWLRAYIIFLPFLAIHWRLNENACILTNLEYWLEHEYQKRPKIRDQEPFVGRILQRIYGRKVTFRTTQFWSHGMLTLAWLLGCAHLHLLDVH